MVPWNQLGDGSIFDPHAGAGTVPDVAWQHTTRSAGCYGQSIQYSMQALTSWVTDSRPELVLVVLGDHQPATEVSGDGANHEVPISIIARDPSVFAKICPLELAGRPAAQPLSPGMADGCIPQ